MKNISEDFKLYNNEKKIDSKETVILEKNKQFYSHNRKYVDTMLKIIKGESNISIRLLDWFISNYSKKNNTCYTIKINNIKNLFFVYNEYKNQLNGYSKNYFDPFCRRKKLVYVYKDKYGKNPIKFNSSIGQLNFFRWAIRNRIIMYVQNHITEIERDMRKTNKNNKKIKMRMSNTNTNTNTNTSSEKTKSTSSNNLTSSEADPIICSSETINSVCITPVKKNTTNSDSVESKRKRRQLSKSVYEYGIVKNNKTIRLDFD